MPRTWTPEQKAAMSVKMKRAARMVSEDEEFLMAHSGNRVQTQEVVKDDSETQYVGGAKVTYTGTPMVTVYKRNKWNGWDPVSVPENNLKILFSPEGMDNYRVRCPQCEGYCGLDGMGCPKGEVRAYRRCLVCNKKIFDSPPVDMVEGEDTPGRIVDTEEILGTPESRTLALRDSHMAWKHPTEYAGSIRAPIRKTNMPPAPGRLAEVS